MRWLSISHTLLNALNSLFDMAVGNENVGPAIVVIVKKETAETQSQQGCAPYRRARRFIDKQTVALVVVERQHLVGEVGDDDAGMPRAVVVGGVYAHAG